MRSRMPVSSAWALRATLGVASTMAPRLRRNPCTVSRYHWMVRKGSLASSRRAAIRLIRQADQVDPQTLLAHHHVLLMFSSCAVGVQQRWHCGQVRAI